MDVEDVQDMIVTDVIIMENMEEYHIGHEIEKEMRAKGKTVR